MAKKLSDEKIIQNTKDKTKATKHTQKWLGLIFGAIGAVTGIVVVFTICAYAFFYDGAFHIALLVGEGLLYLLLTIVAGVGVAYCGKLLITTIIKSDSEKRGILIGGVIGIAILFVWDIPEDFTSSIFLTICIICIAGMAYCGYLLAIKIGKYKATKYTQKWLGLIGSVIGAVIACVCLYLFAEVALLLLLFGFFGVGAYCGKLLANTICFATKQDKNQLNTKTKE